MSKLKYSAFILGFWLLLPLGMAIMGIGGFDSLELNVPSEPPRNIVVGFFQWANSILDILGMYFRLFVFSIAGIPLVLQWGLRFMQLLSLIIMLLILRGTD